MAKCPKCGCCFRTGHTGRARHYHDPAFPVGVMACQAGLKEALSTDNWDDVSCKLCLAARKRDILEAMLDSLDEE